MAEADRALVGFAQALREAGMPVSTGSVIDFVSAASLLVPPDLYWAGRATLVGRHEEIVLYDRVFSRFFGPPRERIATQVQPLVRERPGGEPPPDVPRDPEAEEQGARRSDVLASEVELLRHKRFADCSPEELAVLRRLMGELRFAAPSRRTRRRRPAAHGELDSRRTMRLALRTAGDPARVAASRRGSRARRVVLLLDVSGSMAGYSRGLLTFAHAAIRARQPWEVFCFATRLTRITRTLDLAEPDEALRRAAEEVADWDGGTRIGFALREFLARYGHRGVARGAVVVICSDGLDVGEPELLAEQMARLSRLAHLIVWLNPLKADPRYEPLAAGMRAALPSIDVFSGGHDLASLELLLPILAGTG